jgi:uncharacterized SAM-binding protein YcdF (DUF218 family)
MLQVRNVMFFPLSKIFWLVAEPVTLLTVVALVGVALGCTRYARAGRAIMVGAALGLGLCLLTPLGALLMRPLEARFPAPAADLPAPTGIIVLGGTISPPRTQASGQAVLTSDANRLTTGVELARRYPGARLVFTGGNGSFWQDDASEADGARRLWLALGVPDSQMLFESRSRNTWENAVLTHELLDPKPGETWLLVTSAWHMPRSVGIFRRVGFEVVPYPVAQHTLGDGLDWWPHENVLDRLFMLDASVREWIGLLAYRLTGKTDTLFPGPDDTRHEQVQPDFATATPKGSPR